MTHIGLLNREGKRHDRAHGNKGKIKMKTFPLSGIQVFKQWEYQGVVKELGSSNTEVVNKELLRRWSCKGEAERKPFEDIAENNRRTQNEEEFDEKEEFNEEEGFNEEEKLGEE